MTRLFRRIAVTSALAVAVVAVAAPASLAVPVDPGTGEPYNVPRSTVTKKKKTKRVNQPLSRCREQRHVRIVGCPVPW